MSIDYLIHANTHRAKEGARVLEDIARFVLRDDILFKKIRNIRHSLKNTQVFSHADQSDLGDSSLHENNIRSNLIELAQANFSRIQEALRALEEMTKDSINKSTIKALRFSTYRIQKEFYTTAMKFIKQDKLKGLYLVIDTDIITLSDEKIANIINKSTVNIVQFRSKLSDKRSYLEKAIRLKALLHPDKLFIVNDHLDIALDIADGVHLGQQDYPCERARKLIPDNFILGVTCHNVIEATLAEKSGASYCAVGCLFPTRSKKDATPTSFIELEKIRRAIDIPLCAIGGINFDNISTILSLKINMVAVISSVWEKPNPLLAIESLQDIM